MKDLSTQSRRLVRRFAPSCRVLIVDGDASLLAQCRTALGGNGYQVVTAASGADALAAIADGAIDVALIDMCLSDISAIALTRRLVGVTSAIVILLTGDADDCTHDDAIGEGAADFITKPVRPEELHRRIERARQMRQAAAAKERRIGNLEQLAIRDELTRLFNFRHFRGRLRSEVRRAQRYGRPLSLVMLDVDRFKSLNDTFGHAQGDRALVTLAQIILSNLRTSDDGFRRGGDEFAVLLPETTRVDAERAAERIRHAFAATPLAPGRVVTVSAGVAECRGSDTPEDLLRAADTALYGSKRQGRNRVSLSRA